MMQIMKTFVPSNPIAAVASDREHAAPHVFHSVGVATTLIEKRRRHCCEDWKLTRSRQAIDLIMKIAPFAVACLLFTNTARFGFDLLLALGWFVVTVLLGLALHMFGVYSLAVYFLSRISPLEFFRRVKLVMLTAFSTSSSNATLPTALRVSEENLGVPREIGSFVLTIGATANQNGTALYEGVTVLFLAQLAGVDLSLGQQILVAYWRSLAASDGGCSFGSIPFIVLVLADP